MTLLSLIYWLIIGKTLSPQSYGVVATSLQISMFLSYFSILGMDITVTKLIPELVERKRKTKIQGLIKFSLKIISVPSITIALILIIFSFQLSPLLKLEPKVLWLTALSIITYTLAKFLGSIHYGFQDIKKFFWTNFYGQLTKVVLSSALILLGFGYFGPLVGFLICFLIISITRFSKRLFTISKKTVIDKKLILKYSIPAFVTVIFSILFNNTQYIILILLKTGEATGLFALGMIISSVITVIPSVLSSALFPITSQLSVNKNRKSRQVYLLKLVFRYGLFFTLPIAVFLILFSRYAILFFSRPEYLPATDLLPFLTIAGVFFSLGYIFLSNLYAIGKPKTQRNIFAVVSSVYLFLAIPLTYYFSGRGLAIAYLLSTILFFCLSFIFIRKHLTFKFPVKDIGRIIFGVLVSFLFLILARQFIHNFLVASVFVIVAVIIYLLVLLKLNFYIEEDLKILDFISEKSPILKDEIVRFRNYVSKFISRSYT